MPDSEDKKPAPAPRQSVATREPRALSNEYHKARKQLMLWSAVLFIWELVGIDLDKAREAGGNAGALISSIRSLQAVPWVLLILVAYFLFKCSVEWYQCSPARRERRVSKIDFASAWIVALMAFVLYVGQAISRVQFADVLQQQGKKWSFVTGIVLPLWFMALVLFVWRFRLWGVKWLFVLRCVFLSVILIGTLLGLVITRPIQWTFVGIGVVVASVLATPTILSIKPWHWHKRVLIKSSSWESIIASLAKN